MLCDTAAHPRSSAEVPVATMKMSLGVVIVFSSLLLPAQVNSGAQHYHEGVRILKQYSQVWDMPQADADRASEEFRLAIAADPSIAEAYFNRAKLLMLKATIDKSGKLHASPEVAEDLHIYLRLRPNGSAVYEARTLLEELSNDSGGPADNAPIPANSQQEQQSNQGLIGRDSGCISISTGNSIGSRSDEVKGGGNPSLVKVSFKNTCSLPVGLIYCWRKDVKDSNPDRNWGPVWYCESSSRVLESASVTNDPHDWQLMPGRSLSSQDYNLTGEGKAYADRNWGGSSYSLRVGSEQDPSSHLADICVDRLDSSTWVCRDVR